MWPGKPGAEEAKAPEAETFLADVGFGEAFREPLRLENGAVQAQGQKRFVLEKNEAVWTLLKKSGAEEASFEPVYRFRLVPRAMREFAGMCRFHACDPASHFAKKTVCTLATPGGRITLSGNRFIVTEGEGRTEREVAAPEQPELLRRQFGIALDE